MNKYIKINEFTESYSATVPFSSFEVASFMVDSEIQLAQIGQSQTFEELCEKTISFFQKQIEKECLE